MDIPTPISTVACLAAVATSLATIGYVFISSRSLKALNRQAGALSTSLELTWLGLRFDAVVKQIQLLEDLRGKRHVVYELRPDYTQWADPQKEAVEQVIRAFDIYGLLDRNGFVPRSLLFQFYAYPVKRIWPVVELYIQACRSPHSETNLIGRDQPGHMWELEKLFERSKAAPKHPAESGASDWPPVEDDFMLSLLRRIDSA